MKRYTIRMDDDFHKVLKIHCTQQGITINEYILQVLEKDLKAKTV